MVLIFCPLILGGKYFEHKILVESEKLHRTYADAGHCLLPNKKNLFLVEHLLPSPTVFTSRCFKPRPEGWLMHIYLPFIYSKIPDFISSSHPLLHSTHSKHNTQNNMSDAASDDHEDEVASMLKSMLDNQGVLGKMKAQIRACVYKGLESGATEKPALPNELLLMNELVREYLEHSGFHHTASTLVVESGQPEERIPRNVLSQQLNIVGAQPDLPLLYSVLNTNTA